MVRALGVAAVLVACGGLLVPAQQAAVRLTVTVVLVNAAGTALPVPRHALLVSDYPPSAAPQRIVTTEEGTAGLYVRPGRYIVESEAGVAIDGRAYHWTEIVDVAAGTDTRLSLTVDNAHVEILTDETGAARAGAVLDLAAPGVRAADASPSALLRRWRDHVVSIWSPTRHASGLVVDARGVIATSHRAIGGAASVEVQFAPDVKVSGRVVVADRDRDVALIQVDPSAFASATPANLECSGPTMPLRDEDEVYAIGVPMRDAPDLSFGTVRRVTSRLVVADFALGRLSAGGPVLDDEGALVGFASVADGGDDYLYGESPIVSLDHACAALQSVDDVLTGAAPTLARLPVEPGDSIAASVLDVAVAARGGDVGPYTMSSKDFDLAFITPVMVHAALNQSDPPKMDFSNWNDYVREAAPVLLIRVTPKRSESFWMKLVRGAAMTQGQRLPPITSFKSGFDRLRAFCGEVEVTPIHPFRLELRLSETEAVHEGLSVFAPEALGVDCGTVRLLLYSEDDPDEADTVSVDMAVLRRIREDFAALGWSRR